MCRLVPTQPCYLDLLAPSMMVNHFYIQAEQVSSVWGRQIPMANPHRFIPYAGNTQEIVSSDNRSISFKKKILLEIYYHISCRYYFNQTRTTNILGTGQNYGIIRES